MHCISFTIFASGVTMGGSGGSRLRLLAWRVLPPLPPEVTPSGHQEAPGDQVMLTFISIQITTRFVHRYGQMKIIGYNIVAKYDSLNHFVCNLLHNLCWNVITNYACHA